MTHGTRSRAQGVNTCIRTKALLRGVAADFHFVNAKDPTTWRYTVKLDGGEAFKVKAASVRAEPEGGRRRGGVGEAAEGQRGH